MAQFRDKTIEELAAEIERRSVVPTLTLAPSPQGPMPDMAGVPEWAAEDFRRAQREYDAAQMALEVASFLNRQPAKARLDNARQNLTSARSRLADFKPTVAAKSTLPDYLPPNTTAQWLPRRLPDGTLTWEENQNYVPPKVAEPPSSLLDLYWKQQRYPEEQAEEKRRWESDFQMKREAAEALDRRTRETQEVAERRALMDREAEAERARLQARTSLAGQIGAQWTQNLPYAVHPSWQSYPGFETGGAYEQLVKMGGGTYRPYEIPRQEFDPLRAWNLSRQAEVK